MLRTLYTLHASARFVCKVITRFLGVYSRSSAFQDLKDSLQPFIDLVYFICPAAHSRVGVGLGLGWGWVGLGWEGKAREEFCKVLSQRQSAANYPDPTSTSSIDCIPLQRRSGIHSIYRRFLCRPFGRDSQYIHIYWVFAKNKGETASLCSVQTMHDVHRGRLNVCVPVRRTVFLKKKGTSNWKRDAAQSNLWHIISSGELLQRGDS